MSDLPVIATSPSADLDLDDEAGLPLRKIGARRPVDLSTASDTAERLAFIEFHWQLSGGVQPVLYLERELLQ